MEQHSHTTHTEDGKPVGHLTRFREIDDLPLSRARVMIKKRQPFFMQCNTKHLMTGPRGKQLILFPENLRVRSFGRIRIRISDL